MMMRGGVASLAPDVRLPVRERVAVAAVYRMLRQWRIGSLVVDLPDGTSWQFTGESPERRVTVTVNDWVFFWRILVGGDVGLGESYVAGEWQCDDLVELFRLILRHHALAQRRAPLAALKAFATAWRSIRPLRSRHMIEDVRAHYDLGNEFFALFLDESMTYSAAVFPTPTSDLADAQRNKVDAICRRIALAPGLSVLDIGGGWGSFALHAARVYGCRVLSITLSEAQHALARERVRRAGLESKVDVQLCDYRDVGGHFDRIVSIEMFEAVGYRWWPTFFRTCDRLLAPGGRMFLQTTVYSDRDFRAYRRNVDWLRLHVFPGTLLGSLETIVRILATETGLRIQWMEDIAPHYAATLRCWRERFRRNISDVRRLGFDDGFIRKWDLYLAICEAAFSVRHLGTLQLLIGSAPAPGTAMS
jgi:cyclopropane-fatty-acyl-phospholipid synthase